VIKNILSISLLSAMLLLSGCGEESEGEAQLDTQQMLDEGNFAGVITKLESSADSSADFLALGAAYMGKAGLAMPSLIEIIDNSSDSSDNAFGTFIQDVDKKKSATALNDLEKASAYYKRVIGDVCDETQSASLNSESKDICLFLGLSQTLKAATTITYIADDVTNFAVSGAESDPKLTASTCAMQYAADKNAIIICTVQPEGNFTFANGRTYEEVAMTTNGETFNYLVTGITTVITNGFCPLDDFSKRVNISTSDYHVCPLAETNTSTELTTADVLVQALNDGTDSIGVTSNKDMQDSVDEFKCEVLGGTYYGENSCSENLAQDVTNDQVINYLNKNN
jgi:hypothetical protein